MAKGSKGSKGKKGAGSAKVVQPKQLGVWVWAQCDNAGCQKWRKLPPGTVVDDKEPWYTSRPNFVNAGC